MNEKEKEKIKTKIEKGIKINKNGCWEWIKSKHPYGYGKMKCKIFGKWKTMNLHRLSWLVFKGKIPRNLRVCHNCPIVDNPACCNPRHLFLGTAKDNTRDMMRKKLVFDFAGEKNNLAILKEEQVIEMRNLRKKGMKIKDIANIFNIKYFTCLDAVSGRNWKHIGLKNG